MISTEARAAFLQRIHLFHDMSEEDVTTVAGTLQEESFAEDEPVFEPGAEADRIYFIYRGGVRIKQVVGKEVRELGELYTGDYFGERAILAKHKHTATVIATQKSQLLSMPVDTFQMLLKQFPRLRAALEVASDSRALARRLRFPWLRPGEVIYFLSRKHEVLLGQALTWPILSTAIPIFLVVYFFLTRAFFAIFGAGVLFVAIALWALWDWIDWGNDYYILTSLRVVWLERVIGVYDSRQEAPLSTILSVGLETDQMGRLLDYGNVIIRTYTGKIPFSHVPRPREAAHLVEEQWSRAKRSADRMEKEAMRNVLRQKMGLTVETKVEVPREKPSQSVTPTFYRRSLLKIISSNLFKLRLEDSGTITYRKHWFVLWEQVWQPTVLILLLIGGIIARLITLARTPGQRLVDFTNGFHMDTVVLTLPVLILPLLVWWIYQYIDWRNDIYQVTPDQIIDIDKKPFGTEERSAAPLENILSTEAERIGLAGYLFNYGTVYITVGGTHLDFKDVLDPNAVQADIDRRRETRIARKREVESAAERERMSDWLVAYYENEPDLRRQQAEQGGESEEP
ncbi:MAG TPA: cyclic nucleotide-binding domain-containing protein [Anaerolineales bacterium]